MSSTLLTQELYFTTSTVIDWMDVFTRNYAGMEGLLKVIVAK